MQARKGRCCSLEGEDESEKIYSGRLDFAAWDTSPYTQPGLELASPAALGTFSATFHEKLHVDSLVNGKRLENFPSSSLTHEKFGKILLSAEKKRSVLGGWGIKCL